MVVWPLIGCQYPVANIHVKSLGCVTIKLANTKKSVSPFVTVILVVQTFAGDFYNDFFDHDQRISKILN